MRKTTTFAGDFETTADRKDTRVWAWGMMELESGQFMFGTQLQELIAYCELWPRVKIYYHNLKFDGQFMLHYLFRAGYVFNRKTRITETGAREKISLAPGEFTTLISDLNEWYSIEIKTWNGCEIILWNSLNLIPMKLEEIPDAFGIETQKLHIDYEKKRGIDYALDQDELAYLKNDCSILRQALNDIRGAGLMRMTTAGNALEDYKQRIGRRQFDRWFPAPYYDVDIRRAYRGGYCYCNPVYQGKDIDRGIVLDNNSLYPYILKNKPLPYGEGKHFTGRYQPDQDYPLYTQRLRCIFELKVGKIPTIQIKNKFSRFRPTEYLYSSGGDEVDMTLTSLDLETFLDHYEVTVLEWVDGWKFKAGKKMFVDYVDHWMEIKISAQKQGKPGYRLIAKHMMNDLAGKFGRATQTKEKTPYLTDSGDLMLQLQEPDPQDPIYIPIAAFVTAWGRKIMIQAVQDSGERFLYCDTDSLHLIGWEIPAWLQVDQLELGAWKVERYFDKARYLRAKAYVEQQGEELTVVCSNLQKRAHDLTHTYEREPYRLKLVPKGCEHKVTYDNFRIGTSYFGNLTPRRVPGGVVLEETIFTLKD